MLRFISRALAFWRKVDSSEAERAQHQRLLEAVHPTPSSRPHEPRRALCVPGGTSMWGVPEHNPESLV
ncbi:hypothetical protein Celaphus_00009546 [Cervus elaphus hippelaphus]|uniref:Uncharacterized protein n=1 Tax=Cervus elaphus hippelaphus TaxID=46360 RepID=A0A212C063_CEREH|nr:hypothetical protein Celaphus_00009546 [Cervus elaphus hippelaphus]